MKELDFDNDLETTEYDGPLNEKEEGVHVVDVDVDEINTNFGI